MIDKMKISICIPVYNGAATIALLVEEVKEKLNEYELEIILINDGSKDNSEDVCVDISKKYDFVKFIALRKNFGEHNAVLCGLNYITGDYCVIIDDDFQNPPSEIIALIEESKKGYDVVYSKYEEKKHHWFRNLGSKFNDSVATWLLNKPKGLYLSSFKLIKKEVVDEIIKYKGPFPYIDGLILRVTDNIGVRTVEHSKREEGESNYTLSKLISLWLNMFVNFSIKPLRIATVVGVTISLCSFILGIVFIIEKLIHPDTSMGWTSLMVSILFLSGIQLVFLGIIGEYLGKQYLDQNGTPSAVVKKEYL
ncbi:glycosyl transferase, family 2 [Sulfurimonas gotlandica GD1]|uniref:Glycosyl transferase, family 2 n=1 Tax=Sulfurimonas gotlandica (strain DSM 19862 / JCM 16533 / GD1) TaxID=929558 RepID=B6BKF0_SULGG|nr:glycosyltransferase family 2 protein [Sulfurimonas gotlandica]EDZ62241.1 bactoprenol glucosyl transferase [Sulfurimonas gotlandica GD1]EHP29005.1 glycosyl transferase, family 2 [Sulfurimonas gotlandica GD1]